MITFKPLSDYIVIERVMAKTSIALPENSEACSDDIFEVVAVGSGDDEHPITVNIGDKVCLTGYINTYAYKGVKVILGRSRDVIAIVQDTPF